ncbi:MAG: CDP-alcohol phosphatidyltransferase family protein [Alphaproteobacteria bacterium]
MNVANVISLARLIAVPAIIWAILADEMAAAFWIFVAAGASDAVDGFIARHFRMQTELGGYLDPLADKALLVSVYLACGHEQYLPYWLVILVVFRDILIVGGVLLLYTLQNRRPQMAPLWISKLNTAMQIVLAALVLAGGAFNIPPDRVIDVLIWIVGATTALSGAAYLVKWGRDLAQVEDKR